MAITTRAHSNAITRTRAMAAGVKVNATAVSTGGRTTRHPLNLKIRRSHLQDVAKSETAPSSALNPVLNPGRPHDVSCGMGTKSASILTRI
jgi:hypothetical protein